MVLRFLLSLALLTWIAAGASNDKLLKPHDVPKEGEFHFARLHYPGGSPGYMKNWYTDFPEMDDHLTTLGRRLTGVEIGSPVIVEPSDSKLFEYPMIYTVEPEEMVLGENDVANLREYLSRGGLWFADDFHGDDELAQFLVQLNRVLPDATPIELDVSHPLFHCFFDIRKVIQVTVDHIAKCRACEQWENGPTGKEPKVFAILDKNKRISVLMAWNTDLGDGLEWADDPAYPSEYSAYSFRFLSNVIVYSMTH